ncbi:hypothetical protein J6X15_03640 [Candidatus Saccharibacteria bacterium]|nr:hypothetical protein [Candidatus Saccharibacteria bacterium]MBP5656648.1 hypothetical protein [Candidatus Saccharibacteria bacterium]
MNKLILVYNPRSSHYLQVKKDVVDKLRGLKGWMIGKYEVVDTDVDDNAKRLAKVLEDGNLVIAAGGDGTANIALNGIMLSGREGVRLGVLGYGNFNDTARTFGKPNVEEIIKGEAVETWPLECKINGKHWRYGMCYFTIGMFAEACEVFDNPKTRKSLRKGKKSIFYSIRVLASWWFKERKKHTFMPEFSLGNSSEEYVASNGASDYMAVNGKTVAKMMKGGKYCLQKDAFLSATGRMTKFWPLIVMMARSILKRIPGTESDYDKLVFRKPAKMMFQAEGEYKMIPDVSMVEIKKSAKPLLVIMK